MPLKASIVALLSLFAIASCITRYQNANMADFYNFWGVAAAKQWTPSLQGPYIGKRGPNEGAKNYAAALVERTAQSDDPRLKQVAQLRRSRLNLTSTPLLYATFGLFSSPRSSYTASFRNYFVLQVMSFAGAIFVLAYAWTGAGFLAAAMALTLVVVFVPFHSDLNVGNFNSIQLGFVSLLVLAAERGAVAQSARRKRIGSFAILAGLVLSTLLKPNLILVSLAMALHLIALHGWRSFGRWLLPGATLFGALLILWSGNRFGRVDVWLDWYHRVFGADPGRLVFSVDTGNVSGALLVSQGAQVSLGSTLIVLAAALVFSAVGALTWASTRAGGRSREALRSLADAFRDPALAASMGLILTFALMPLAWFHYYVLILLPALWLAAKPDHSLSVRFAGALAIVLAAGVIQPVVGPLVGWRGMHRYATAFCWVPLWVAMLTLMVRRTLDRRSISAST